MSIENYYLLNQDIIHFSILGIARKLAQHRLMTHHNKTLTELIVLERSKEDLPERAEPANLADIQNQNGESCHFKEEYREEFDKCVADEYDKIADLMRFKHEEYSGTRCKNVESLLMDAIMVAMNGSFNFGKFAERIEDNHRTLQQRFFHLMKTSMLHMASGNIHVDGRNRASFNMCVELEPMLKKHPLPFI